jgi:hypothetical protein
MDSQVKFFLTIFLGLATFLIVLYPTYLQRK